MTTDTFETFQARALAGGAEEVLERHWAPGQVIDTHSHLFDAEALVTAGEMWLIREDGTQHLRVGDTFRLSNGTPHSERYGPEGATYWVARRNSR
jgi:quercetin dioxygenase-like cupin family protein